MPDIPPYAQLKARATELGIRSVGVKGVDLAAAIEAEKARLAADPAAAAAAQVADAEPETPKGKGKAVPIVRQDAIRWWCPIDDFAMPPYMKGCAKCGAQRRGDSVIPA